MPLPTTDLPSRQFQRLHGAKRRAADFRLNPSHRFSHPNAPGGLLYLGEDFDTCVWECFGDKILEDGAGIARSTWNLRMLSRIVIQAPLQICDLTDLNVRRELGLDMSALGHTNFDIPHAWGLAIQTHPQQPDGLRYSSRFTSRPCLALFERPGIAAKLVVEALGLLPDLDESGGFLDTHRIALV